MDARTKLWFRVAAASGTALALLTACGWYFVLRDPFEGAPRVTPEQVESRIGLLGAKWVVQDLWEDHHWDDLADGIGSGDANWLRIAPALVPGVDAARAEELRDNLGLALPKNAPAVLAAIDPANGAIAGADSVCSVAFGNNLVTPLSANYVANSVDAVAAVRNPALATVKARCLATLHRGICTICG